MTILKASNRNYLLVFSLMIIYCTSIFLRFLKNP